MNSWIDLKAVGEIVLVGLLAGAGLPALFAVGMKAMSMPRSGQREGDTLVGGNPVGMAVGGLCFLVVLAAVAYAIYLIVAGG